MILAAKYPSCVILGPMKKHIFKSILNKILKFKCCEYKVTVITVLSDPVFNSMDMSILFTLSVNLTGS